MEFWMLVIAIVVALLVYDMLKDAIAGVAVLAGAAAASIARRIWK